MREMPEAKEKRLELYCTDTPNFIFEISNTCPDTVNFDENGVPLNKENQYGIHTLSILAFTKKHDAVIDYVVQDGMFRLRLLIQDED